MDKANQKQKKFEDLNLEEIIEMAQKGEPFIEKFDDMSKEDLIKIIWRDDEIRYRYATENKKLEEEIETLRMASIKSYDMMFKEAHKYLDENIKLKEEIKWHEEENGCALGVQIGKLKEENINLEEQNIQYIKWFAEINEICGAEPDDPAVESVKDKLKECKDTIKIIGSQIHKEVVKELIEASPLSLEQIQSNFNK
jgi:hypothetical protein|tara:strand:+ start:161 stop:751 length:591 start_codon:yes stop_codon:yes gene_type:complete